MRGVYGGVRDEVIHAAFIVAWKQNKPPKELRVFLFPYRRQQKKKNPWRRSIAMGRKCAREPRRKCWKEEQVEPACLFIYYIYIFLFLSSFFFCLSEASLTLVFPPSSGESSFSVVGSPRRCVPGSFHLTFLPGYVSGTLPSVCIRSYSLTIAIRNGRECR